LIDTTEVLPFELTQLGKLIGCQLVRQVYNIYQCHRILVRALVAVSGGSLDTYSHLHFQFVPVSCWMTHMEHTPHSFSTHSYALNDNGVVLKVISSVEGHVTRKVMW